MLETLGQWLVRQPAHVALIGVANLALWVLCRATALRKVPKSNVLWVPAVLWFAFAGWEWLVLAKSPEANIRVDLLVIWPVIAIVSLWALLRTAAGWWRVTREAS